MSVYRTIGPLVDRTERQCFLFDFYRGSVQNHISSYTSYCRTEQYCIQTILNILKKISNSETET